MDQRVRSIRSNTVALVTSATSKKIQEKISVMKTEFRAFPSLRKGYRYLAKSNY